MKEAEKEYWKFLLRVNTDKNIMDFYLPDRLSKKFVAYQGMHLDLSNCKKFLEKLSDKNDEITETALYTSFVILYGKCFADSTSTKFPKLEKDVFQKTAPNHLELHNRIIDMRNNYIAHRGNSNFDQAKVFFQINPETMQWGIQVGNLKLNNFEKSEINRLTELIDFLLDVVLEKHKKNGEKTLEYIFNNFSQEEIDDLYIPKNNLEQN